MVNRHTPDIARETAVRNEPDASSQTKFKAQQSIAGVSRISDIPLADDVIARIYRMLTKIGGHARFSSGSECTVHTGNTRFTDEGPTLPRA